MAISSELGYLVLSGQELSVKCRRLMHVWRFLKVGAGEGVEVQPCAVVFAGKTNLATRDSGESACLKVAQGPE
jgi:hypothetical protein